MHILIIGSSIAGPALAFWLRRYGIDATVVERAPALREGGYCVDLRGSALEVIERMGLRETLRPLEADTVSNALVDERGRRFGRTPRGFGVIDEGDIEILRGDLSRVLYEATRESVRYRFGESVTAIDRDPNGVNVTFTNGAIERFDAVIGADGVHSRTRALVFGPEESVVRPMGSCMAVFSAPNHLGLDREQLLFMGAGQIASIKSADANRTLKISVFFTTPSARFDHHDVESQRRLVADAFANSGWEFPRFVDAMWECDDFYCDLTCQVRMEHVVEGRVALIGDAAHCPSPLSGQGSSLAIVGAYVLATELARGGDVTEALSRYDAAIKPFAVRNQDLALKLGSGFAPRSPFEARMRRFAMRLLPYMPGSQAMMKLSMREIREAAFGIALPARAA